MDYRFGELTVACTNVERVMYPEDAITKGELLAYYRDVAALMLPELSGRPLSVVRYTKRIDKGMRCAPRPARSPTRRAHWMPSPRDGSSSTSCDVL